MKKLAGPGSRRQDNLVLPRAARENRSDRGSVLELRHLQARGYLQLIVVFRDGSRRDLGPRGISRVTLLAMLARPITRPRRDLAG